MSANLNHEIAALHLLPDQTFNGDTIAYAGSADDQAFEIYLDAEAGLCAAIYAYDIPETGFNVDEWERHTLHIQTEDRTRVAFAELYRISRGFISGRDIVLPSGATINRYQAPEQWHGGVAA